MQTLDDVLQGQMQRQTSLDPETKAMRDAQNAEDERLMQVSQEALMLQAASVECVNGSVCGGSGFIRFDLPVRHPYFGMGFPCSCRQQRQNSEQLERLFTAARIPQRYASLGFDTFARLPLEGKQRAFELAKQMADPERFRNERGLVVQGVHYDGLVLYGPVGRGKTGLSAAVARAWLDARKRVLWITWQDFLDDIRSTFNPNSDADEHQMMRAARRADLLVLDELGDPTRGGGKPVLRDHFDDRVNPEYQVSDFARRITRAVIGARHRERLATFVTTNLTPDEIYYQFGSAIADRIDEACLSQPVEGVNLRSQHKESAA